MDEYWMVNDVPEFLRSKSGDVVRLSDGEISILIGLSKLTINSRLAALGLNKEELLAHWREEFLDRLNSCIKMLEKKITWAATGDPVLIREPEIWQDVIGISCSFRSFRIRAKRGTVDERDLELLELFLNGCEILIDD